MKSTLLVCLFACSSFAAPPALSPTGGQENDGQHPTLVADALDWYAEWRTLGATKPDVQACRGEFRGTLYSFRCDPLSVVVGVAVDNSGRCSVVSMIPSSIPDDGLRVQTLENLVPRRSTEAAQPKNCGELPVRNGIFELVVMPHSREISTALTMRARVAALTYLQHPAIPPCVLRFPNVKAGDPFFHVYEECEGSLDMVLEFGIKNGSVANFSQWDYTRRKGDLPDSAEWRRHQESFWSGVSKIKMR